MPKRVNQHEIEDISRAKFQLALPRKWVYRDKDKDYGIDGEVELFDNDKNPNGLVFWLQLKATESKKKENILNIDFSIETLRYYKTLDIPVLLVRYSDFSNSFYIKWINNIDLFFAKKNAKTFRIKLTKNDEFDETSHIQIENYLTRIRLLKSGTFNFPLDLNVSVNESKINGFSKAVLLTQIKKEIQEYSDFIKYTNNENKSSVSIHLSNEELKIDLSNLSGCSFHSINEREKENFSKGIVKDILIGLAISMIKLGKIEYLGQLIFENNLEYRLLKKKEILNYCLRFLFQSSYFEKTIALVEQILDDDESYDVSLITQISLLFTSTSKNKKKNKAIENFLLKRLENSLSKDISVQIGISHYNLGNYYKGKNLYLKALKHYNLARKSEPKYLNQPYYFAELGSIFFLSDKYRFASIMYLKSINLKEDNHTLGLYADSLFYAGEYKKANVAFTNHINKTNNPTEEFILKNICLETLLEEKKIDKQIRDERKADKLADIRVLKKGVNPIKQFEKALEFDLLSGLAWFNLGIQYSEQNSFSQASFSFTMASLVNTNNIEAWRNATLCSLNSKKDFDVIPLIVRTAYFFHREKYLEELYTHLENQNTTESIENIIKLIESIIPENQDKNELPTVRILNKEGKFEDINELIKGHNNGKKNCLIQ